VLPDNQGLQVHQDKEDPTVNRAKQDLSDLRVLQDKLAFLDQLEISDHLEL
jgi:hypothetical protein